MVSMARTGSHLHIVPLPLSIPTPQPSRRKQGRAKGTPVLFPGVQSQKKLPPYLMLILDAADTWIRDANMEPGTIADPDKRRTCQLEKERALVELDLARTNPTAIPLVALIATAIRKPATQVVAAIERCIADGTLPSSRLA